MIPAVGTGMSISRQVLLPFSFTRVFGLFALISVSVSIGVSECRVAPPPPPFLCLVTAAVRNICLSLWCHSACILLSGCKLLLWCVFECSFFRPVFGSLLLGCILSLNVDSAFWSFGISGKTLSSSDKVLRFYFKGNFDFFFMHWMVLTSSTSLSLTYFGFRQSRVFSSNLFLNSFKAWCLSLCFAFLWILFHFSLSIWQKVPLVDSTIDVAIAGGFCLLNKLESHSTMLILKAYYTSYISMHCIIRLREWVLNLSL